MSRLTLSAGGAFVLPFLLLGSCNDPDGSSASLPAPSITNLGLAGASGELAGQGTLWLLAAREFDSGGRDLDGDGDAFDRVVYVQDLASGTARNTGLALDTRTLVPILEVGEDFALFAASEPGTGGRDLNGDGDANDAVLYVVERASGTTRNLARALALDSVPALEGALVAFVVSEAAQGNVDLDGDGSSAGSVLEIYDAATQELTNTRLPVASPVFVRNGQVAYFAAETSVDLNGDGDLLDLAVLQVYDVATDTNLNTGLATNGTPPLEAGGVWLASVSESAQGADLDRDLDLADDVLVVFDPSVFLGVPRGGEGGAGGGAAPSRSLELVSGGPLDTLVSPSPEGAERFGLLVPEASGVDLNGDGDLLDRVAFLYDPATQLLTDTGRASVRIVFSGSWLAFLALEAAQGSASAPATDLNGDGDVLDAVAFLLNPVTLGVTNLRQDALELFGSDDAVLLLLRPESGSATDWNLDGDLLDAVVHVHDRNAGTTISTGIASVGAFGATLDHVLLYADELSEGSDLDLDGDRIDQVYVLFDVAKQERSNLALAGSGLFPFARLASDGKVLLLASELEQGRDLNGDGDLADEILHRAE